MLDKETDIEVLDLTIRSKNCLRAEKINTVEELMQLSDNEILKIPNTGKKTWYEILDVLKKYKKSEIINLEKEIFKTINDYFSQSMKEINEIRTLVVSVYHEIIELRKTAYIKQQNELK